MHTSNIFDLKSEMISFSNSFLLIGFANFWTLFKSLFRYIWQEHSYTTDYSVTVADKALLKETMKFFSYLHFLHAEFFSVNAYMSWFVKGMVSRCTCLLDIWSLRWHVVTPYHLRHAWNTNMIFCWVLFNCCPWSLIWVE